MKKYVPKNQKADYLSKFDDRRPAGYPPESEFPPVIILKRKAIRVYPDNQKIALYYSQALDKYISIPIGPNNKAMGMYMNEETEAKDDSDDDKKKKKVVGVKVPHESFIKNNIGAIHPELYAAYKEGKKRKNEHDAFLHAMSRLTKEQFKALPIKTQIEAHKHFRESIDLASSESFNHFMANLGAKFGSKLRQMYLERREKSQKKKSGMKPPTDTPKQETPEETLQPKKQEMKPPVRERIGALKSRIEKPKPGPRQMEEASDCFARILAEKRGERLDELAPLGIPALISGATAVGRAAAASGLGRAASRLVKRQLAKMRKKQKEVEQSEADKELSLGDRMAGKKGKTPGKKGLSGRAIRGAAGRAAKRGAAGIAKFAGGAAEGLKRFGTKQRTGVLTPAEIRYSNLPISGTGGIGSKSMAKYYADLYGPGVSPQVSMEESTIETLNYIVENNIDIYPVTINERTINVNKSIAKKIVNVYESLNKKNRKKARKMLDESVDSFRNFTNFALRY